MIAIIQSPPAFHDLACSLKLALAHIEEAAANGAQLIVFGECWFTGYPAWLDICSDVALWDHEPVKAAWAKMFENGMEIPGKEFKALRNAAKQHAVTLVIGMNEIITKGPGNNTIYNAVVTIDRKGKLANHHRKLMPTYTEKLVHGLGDGHGLRSVETPLGRVGALICWEHWMPLARQAMHDQHEDIHIALWPSIRERHILASRHYAFEGRCVVVAVGQMQSVAAIPEGLTLAGPAPDFLLNGGSCVIGPTGDFILEPQFDFEGILYVEMPPLHKLLAERMNLATSGHYQRHDVFRLKVDRRRLK
jgi:predicted amidohydrolase